MEKSRYTIKDFDDCKFNVLAIGNKKVIEAFPILKTYPEFQDNVSAKVDTESLFKYVLLMYTENILNRTIPDLMLRKKEAALLAGFEIDLKTKRFPVALEKIFLCEYDEVNQIIIRVVRLSRSNKFENLAIFEETRARQMRKLLSDDNENEKIKDIHDNIKRLSTDITLLEKEVLFEDDSSRLLDKLYYSVDNFNLGIRPEEIAEAKKAGALKQYLVAPYEERVVLKKYTAKPKAKTKKRG